MSRGIECEDLQAFLCATLVVYMPTVNLCSYMQKMFTALAVSAMHLKRTIDHYCCPGGYKHAVALQPLTQQVTNCKLHITAKTGYS